LQEFLQTGQQIFPNQGTTASDYYARFGTLPNQDNRHLSTPEYTRKTFANQHPGSYLEKG
jgi:hypothetical protein